MENVTFIIPVKITCQERYNNLDFCVNFLQTNFKSKIILMEEDEESKIAGRYQNIQHVFLKTFFPLYQRTTTTNKAVHELVDTKYICLLDMDVFIDPDIYIKAVEHLKDYSVVYPFSGLFYEIPQVYNQNRALRMADINEADKITLGEHSPGGMVFFRTIDYIQGGMDNEFSVGWGYEDNERFIRFTKLGYRIKRLDNPIYHFTHPRGLNSSGANPNIVANRTECEKTEFLPRNALIERINNLFHWCKKRKIMQIVIIIPTHEMGGRGEEFLRYNLGKILEQTFPYYRVIVTDHSLNDDIKLAVESYHDDRFLYLKNENNRGSSSANLNHGIAHAGGGLIKPMFQDDYFHSRDALAIIHEAFLTGIRWMMVGSNDTLDRTTFTSTLVPTWNDRIVHGRNTLGSPSCIAYYSDINVVWDERLLWLMDCKFYWDMYTRFGLPHIEPRTLVTNFGHPAQVSRVLTEERKKSEVDLMKKEFPK